MVSVVSVVGARPQFVKAFPVSHALAPDHEEVIVHTGQHYDEQLSDVFFEELDIPTPDYNLGVGSDTHAVQTAEMMTELDGIIARHGPDVLLLYGDTNSTLAGALVGAKRDTVVAHVEAGLRSHNWEMPEEINRVLTDHVSDLLFVPTARATETLVNEGITDGVYESGDVMYDALLAVRERVHDRRPTTSDAVDGEYVLATVHRAANTADTGRLTAILTALSETSLPVVLPAHPRTTDAMNNYEMATDDYPGIEFVDPVGYLDFVALLDGAERVATDSGGVQKEAFYLDTPCVTLREETEWVETVECGWNVLVGADEAAIRRALERPFEPDSKPRPYGDGDAAAHIAEVVGRG
ncbi:non-hydrolyzing UDP-N-acetylglucosamine 2-epimerase [Salinibaculum salinum]|uniref:non-hydrolyzing UDP-N-acetylglucosamine 2-epimerase n=1 Tax=Salinibaculum salinum TaxID=3131996 RepID=UPI003A981651